MNLHSLTRRLFHRAFRSRPATPIRKRPTGLRRSIELLEDRSVPATMFAVTAGNELLQFDSATPGTIDANNPIIGLQPGEFILGLDVRPATAQLYGLGITNDGATRTGRIYTIDPANGAATQVGSTPWSTSLENTSFWGFDFNPNVDLIRVVSDLGSNFRVSPNTGALVGTDTSLSQTGIDDVAYTNNAGTETTTTLYGIRYVDNSPNSLKTIGGLNGSPSPNGGVVVDVGSTGVSGTDAFNFDIEAGTGIARATLRVLGGTTQLFTINLTTGAATSVGDVDDGSLQLRGLTTAQTAIAVGGTAGDDTLVVIAIGADSGTYSLNGGAAVAFSGIPSFAFLGSAGNDTLTIINPAGGLFAPAGGIVYNGGQPDGAPGDRLEILGGAHTSETHTFTPDGADGHNGGIALVNGATTANYTYTGLEPILVNAGTPTDIVFNLPTGDGTNQAILEDNALPADNLSRIRSQSGTFETTQFVNPTNSLTVNYGNDGEVVTVAQLDPAFAPAMALDLNGGAGFGVLRVDFASGSNVIPVNGINFDGAGGADGINLLPGYSATTVTYAFGATAQDGTIDVDGRLITFTGQDSSVGLFDQLTAADRVFNLGSTPNIVTLGTGFAAADGFSRIATSPDTSLLTDFANPTGSLTINRGDAADALTIDALGVFSAALTAGSAGNPFASIDVIGAVTSASGISIFGNSIAVDALLTAATTVTLNAGTGAITTLGGGTDVAATNLVATATTGIDLDTNVANITATTSGAGSILINEVNGVTLTSVTAANGAIAIATGGTTIVTSVVSTTDSDANDISITASAGDMTVNTLTAGGTAGDVTLQATTGNIFDDGANGTVITADSLTLTADRAIGAPGATAQIDSTVNSLTATTTGAGPFAGAPTPGSWVGGTNALTVTSATTQDGVIVLDSAGTMTVGVVSAGGTARNVRLRTSAGNIDFGAAGSVSAAGDNIRLEAFGAITESGAAVKVTAAGLVAVVGSDVGAVADPLNTDIANLAATAGTGGVFVANANSLSVAGVTAFGTINGITANAGSVGLAATNVSSTAAGTIGTANGLTIDVTGTTGTLIGVVSGGATATLAKLGVGTLTLAAVNTYAGTTTVNAGTLLVNGSIASNAIVNNSATLGGTGSIAGSVNVNNTARLAPGASPETLATGSVAFVAGTFFDVEIGGTTAGTEYDQLIVTGAVDLGGATLTLIQFGGFVPSSGVLQSFTIIDNDTALDAVTGTFAGLFEGSVAGTVGGVNLYISYSGGDGNDVVLSSQPVVNGTPGDDTLVLRQVAGDPSLVEFSLNGTAFVAVSSTVPFTFNGFGGTDLLLVDTANGDPISTGDVAFDGEILRTQGTGVETATLAPSTTGGQGTFTLAGFGNVAYTSTTDVDLINLASAQVQTGSANDTISIADGSTVTNGGTVPGGYNLAPVDALTISGTLVPDVALTDVTSATVTTIPGGDGNDAVTIASGSGAHGVSNLSIDTGTGIDTVTVTGNLTVAGDISIATQNIAFSATLTVGTTGTTNTLTLNAGAGAITTSSAVRDVFGLNLSAIATLGIDLDTAVGLVTAITSGAGAITLDEFDAVQLTNVIAANGLIGVTAGGAVAAVNVVSTTDADANDIGISTTVGNITVTSVSAGAAAGDVNLTAMAGSLLDDNSDGSLTTGDVLTLRARNTIGAPLTGGAEDMDTNAASIDAVTTGVGANNGIWVADLGTVTFTQAVTADGVVVLDAATGLTANVITAGGTRNIRIRTTTSGDVTLGSAAADAVTAAGASVLIQAAGGVVDGNGGSNNVAALNLAATGANGVGTVGNPIDTTVANLASTGANGGVFVVNAGALTVANVTAFGVMTNGVTATGAGAIFLTATAGSMTAQSAITAGTGSINLTTTGAGNAIAVNSAVSSTSGPITAVAAGAITQTGGSFGTTGTLLTTSAGGQDLDGANTVGTFDATNASGGVTLNNTAALTIARIIETVAGSISVTNSGSVAVGGAGVSTTNGNVGLTANGGALNVGAQVLSTTGGAVGLTANGGGLAIAAPVTASGGAVGLTTTSAGNAIAVNGVVTAAGPIAATAGGAITQAGGNFAGPSLTTASSGGQTLTGANTVGSFNATNAGADVRLNNSIALNVTGIGQIGGGAVSVSNADRLTVTGGISADTGGIDLNVLTNGIDLTSGASKVSTAGAVLLNPTAGGVDQSAASLGVIGGTINLLGAGAFVLNSANNDAIGTLRANVTGALTFRDGNSLALDSTGGVKAGNNNITLFTGANFTAEGATPSTVLVDAGNAVVRIVPDTAAGVASTFRFNAEVRGSAVFYGNDDPSVAAANLGADRFAVTPSRISNVTVVGNNPTTAPGDSITPIFSDPDIVNVNFIVENVSGQSISGRYEITYANNATSILRFRQIESLGNLGFRAIVVQTDPQVYSVRLQLSQLTPFPGSVRGQALQSSPFVVSPNFVNPNNTYTAPSLAFGDVNGDGTVDLVIANGSNDLSLVTVINGSSLFAGSSLDLGNLRPDQVIARFFAFPDASGRPTFRGGLNVVVKSNGAGNRADIVLGPGTGGGPVVQTWGIAADGTASLKSSFFAFEESFRGGVTVAAGDYDGNGTQDVIVGTGPGGAPRVQVFGNGDPNAVLANFFAYDSNFRGGVFVAAGNFDGAGGDDIATAPGFGGGPHIAVFKNAVGGPARIASFFAWDPIATNGLQTLGTNANNGVGSISFGAPALDAPGVADPLGRRELLVSSARGTALQMRRFSFADDAAAPNRVFNLYNELTDPNARDEFGVLLNGIPILDSMTGQALTEAQLFDGGGVAGFAPR